MYGTYSGWIRETKTGILCLMVGVFIEFRNNADLLKQSHGYRDDITLNRKYSDYKPGSRKNIETWAISV